MCAESLALYQKLGQARGVAMASHNLGTIEWALHLPDHGRARLQSALDQFRNLGDKAGEAICLSGLASSLVRCADTPAALTRLRECLAPLESLELARERIYFLDALGEALHAMGQPADAARLIGAANAERIRLGAPLMPAEREEMEKLRARIAETLGRAEAERCLAEGAELSGEQALAKAVALLGPVRSG